jgi:hypothetical protein|tara:strand:+ start:141 stop:365 length:225 start_codon:yes stop_codon:yes gene_type:complete
LDEESAKDPGVAAQRGAIRIWWIECGWPGISKSARSQPQAAGQCEASKEITKSQITARKLLRSHERHEGKADIS